MTSTRARRRLGAGLLAFGVTGVALIVAGGVLVLGSLTAVDAAATNFERQRAELVAMVRPASLALSRAGDSAANASASLTVTSDAAERAGGLATSLAESFEGLAALGSFEVFGLRPFAGLSGDFAAVGSDSRRLATDLHAAAAAMRTNVTDSAAVATDLRALAAQLDRLEASLGESGAGAGSSASLQLGLARIVLLGLLAWFAVPALASTWLGWRLLRRGRGRLGPGHQPA